MRAPFKVSQRLRDRDTDVAVQTLLTNLNREAFLERSLTATLPCLRTNTNGTVPLWSPAWDGFVLRRGTLLVGTSAPKSSDRARYVTVKVYVRTGVNEAEAVGDGWDSRYNALTGGVPFPLFGEVPSDMAIPANAVVEARVTQGGQPTFDVSTLRVQVDVAWDGVQ